MHVTLLEMLRPWTCTRTRRNTFSARIKKRGPHLDARASWQAGRKDWRYLYAGHRLEFVRKLGSSADLCYVYLWEAFATTHFDCSSAACLILRRWLKSFEGRKHEKRVCCHARDLQWGTYVGSCAH